MEIANFTEKYDKIKGNTYSVEEQIEMPESGKYDAMLKHDNADDNTVQVWTGSGLSGSKVSFTLSAPSERPFKRRIEFSTQSATVYISYECAGDQVEAEDINNLQNEVKKTQQFANQIAEDVRGTSSAFTWNQLMGITSTAAISIIEQPTNKNVTAGGQAEFTIAASGTSLRYKWQYCKRDETTWKDCADGAKNTLAFIATADWNRAHIRCIVSNEDGDTVISDSVLLTVST